HFARDLAVEGPGTVPAQPPRGAPTVDAQLPAGRERDRGDFPRQGALRRERVVLSLFAKAARGTARPIDAGGRQAQDGPRVARAGTAAAAGRGAALRVDRAAGLDRAVADGAGEA